MDNWDYVGYNHMGWGMGPGIFGLIFAPIFIALVLWSLYWKYRAIWYAVKHDEKWWFIAFLVVNTLGILEILYLYVFSKKAVDHDEKNVPMVQ